jgi:ribonuclease HI
MTFFFDGGCRPNPGPIEIAVVTRGQANFRDDLGIGDNNEAEWLALLHALEIAIVGATSDVLLIGDSTLVIEQASGRWPCRSAHLKPYLERFRALAPQIRTLKLRQVPRSKNLAGIALARRGLP